MFLAMMIPSYKLFSSVCESYLSLISRDKWMALFFG